VLTVLKCVTPVRVDTDLPLERVALKRCFIMLYQLPTPFIVDTTAETIFKLSIDFINKDGYYCNKNSLFLPEVNILHSVPWPVKISLSDIC